MDLDAVIPAALATGTDAEAAILLLLPSSATPEVSIIAVVSYSIIVTISTSTVTNDVGVRAGRTDADLVTDLRPRRPLLLVVVTVSRTALRPVVVVTPTITAI